LAVRGLVSCWPIRTLPNAAAPTELGRWLLAGMEAPTPFAIGARHILNRVIGRKSDYVTSVLELI
jgi:hypothetical protein